MITTQKSFPAGAKAREVASAELTTVWGCAQSQLEASGEIGVVVLFRPRAQFHAVTLRTARVNNLGRLRDGTLKPGMAAFAAQLAYADQLQYTLCQALSVRRTDVPCSARRAHRFFPHGFHIINTIKGWRGRYLGIARGMLLLGILPKKKPPILSAARHMIEKTLWFRTRGHILGRNTSTPSADITKWSGAVEQLSSVYLFIKPSPAALFNLSFA